MDFRDKESAWKGKEKRLREIIGKIPRAGVQIGSESCLFKIFRQDPAEQDLQI